MLKKLTDAQMDDTGAEDEAPMITVCQGPPKCDLEGDEAVAAALAGCHWCERHRLMPDGNWDVQKPGVA